MVTKKKLRIYQILLLGLALTLSNCLTDQYDLSKGVNTDMSVGGDSLSIPLGKTDSIFLGKLINGQNIGVIQKNADGSYSLIMQDSMHVKMDAINPVTFEVIPISKISKLPIPPLDFNNKKISGINSSIDIVGNLSTASLTRRLNKSILLAPSQSNDRKTIVISDGHKINQTLSFVFPIESGKPHSSIKKINKIYFKTDSNTVTLTIARKSVPSAITNPIDTTKSFEIDFPGEFELKTADKYGAVAKENINGILKSIFTIKNAPLVNGTYSAQFNIVSLDMSGNTDQETTGTLVYDTGDIPYNIKYSCTCDISLPILPQDELVVTTSIAGEPKIDDIEIMTNLFDVPISSGSVPINQSIKIPTEIISLSSISLNEGATLNLNFKDPGIDPFIFNGGNCLVELPKTLKLSPYDGLNLDNNELIVGFNKLFTPISIGILGIKTEKTVLNDHVLTISDSLKYTINNLTVGSQTARLNTLLGIKNKQLRIDGSTAPSTGLSVSTIVGKINPVIDPISQSIKLDLPDAFKNSGNNLDIQNPKIDLIFGNTMGFPIDIPMDLIPYSKGVAIKDASITTSLHILEAAVSKYRITTNGQDSSGLNFYPDGIPFLDGYISKPIPNLPNLLKTIPDRIEVKVTPDVKQNNDISFDLNSKTNQLDVNYWVNVPLNFGGNFKFQYKDTIINLQESLKDLLKYTRNINIIAKVKNQMPIDLTFRLSPRNSKGDSIPGIIVETVDTIRSGVVPTLAGIPITTSSKIKIGISENIEGALGNLDKFYLTVSASKEPTSKSTPLNSKQFMIIELNVEIPKGLNIKQ